MADSFCIAGEWLYYSARTQRPVRLRNAASQLQMNLETMELESTGPFRLYEESVLF